MARGRLLRTKRREAYNVEKAKTKGSLQATEEHDRKHPFAFIKRLMLKAAENVDPVEITAILGATIVIHEVVIKTQPFVSSLENLKPTLVGAGGGLVGIIIANLMGNEVKETMQMPADWMVWLVCFGIAYFCVRHGADLLGTAKSFFGVPE